MELTSKRSDFLLRCSTACKEPAPPPTVYLLVTLDSLLRPSYLPESVLFSVPRFAALLSLLSPVEFVAVQNNLITEILDLMIFQSATLLPPCFLTILFK